MPFSATASTCRSRPKSRASRCASSIDPDGRTGGARMKTSSGVTHLALLVSAWVLSGSIAAQAANAPPMVEWVVPALTTNNPQTPEQAKEGQLRGRELPPPEVLQPALDAQLPAYVPTKEKLAGTFKGAASDVMVVLAQKWFQKFKTYHPDVNLTISPPYAGSLGAIELVKGDLDFVFVSRELKPDDVKGFQEKYGYAPLSVPVSGGSYRHFGALDAVAFFVHKD